MPVIIVASHHKAGSTYAKNCFFEVATILGYRFEFYGFGELPDLISSSFQKDTILCFSHARLDDLVALVSRVGLDSCKLVHIIRDPRTLIVSATKYHLDSDERWLSQPMKKYGGLSYQQFLRTLPSYPDQLIFEMTNGTRGTLADMSRIYMERIATITIRLEDISWDVSGWTHQHLSEHLVDDSLLLGSIKSVFLKHSLFSLQTPPRHSRTMVSPSFKDDLTGNVQQTYRNLFGELHLKMGYND